jgi:predicted nucleic acid-binding protein
VKLVLEENAAIEIIQDRPVGKHYKELIEISSAVISTEFFKIEVANVLRKLYNTKKIDKEDIIPNVAKAVALVTEFIPIELDYIEALKESIRLGYSAYDMLYFLIARRNKAILLTLDAPLARIAREQGIETEGAEM